MSTRMRVIMYGIDERGQVWSRVGDQVMAPFLDYEKIGEGGDFTAPLTYHYERLLVPECASSLAELRWTKKIPVEIKNKHRAMWGFKPLKGAA